MSLRELTKKLDGKVIWCGDFNGHCTLCDGYDATGEIIEELIKIKNLVCFNDGSGTRITRSGTELATDLTLVSEMVAGRCNREIIKQTIMLSDH